MPYNDRNRVLEERKIEQTYKGVLGMQLKNYPVCVGAGRSILGGDRGIGE